jgi:hypothetical protein
MFNLDGSPALRVGVQLIKVLVVDVLDHFASFAEAITTDTLGPDLVTETDSQDGT